MANLPPYKGQGDFAEFVLTAAAEYLIELMVANLEAHGLKDSRIIKGITYTIKGDRLTINLPDYAQWVEQGRRPFGNESPYPVNTLPPASAILEWIRRKGIKGRDKKGRFISNNSLAWAIRTMIAKRGIRPRPFVAPALEAGEKELNEYFGTSYSLFLDESIRDIIGG